MALINEIIEKGEEKFLAEDQPLLIEEIEASYQDVYREGKRQINNLKRELLALQYDLDEHDPDTIADKMEEIFVAERKLENVAEAFKKMFDKDIVKK